MSETPDTAALARAEAIAAMARDPKIADAVRTIFTGVLARYDARGLFSRVVSDRSRFLLSYMAFYLDAGYEEGDPDSGLTASSYMALCASTGLCRREAAFAMLWLMRVSGYLVPASATRRRGPRRLVPSERFLAMHRSRWEVVFTALAQLRPEGAAGLALVEDPRFFRPFIRGACDRFFTRERLLSHAPALVWFAGRRAGFNILMALAMSAQPGDDMPPRGPIEVSVDDLARRFGISRRQVRDTLTMAVDAGLLLRAKSGAYSMADPLRTSIINFIGAMLLVAGESAAEAEAQLRSGDRPSRHAPADHAA